MSYFTGGFTEEQLAERRLGIGGSDAKMVIEGEWQKLWRLKTGRAQPEDLTGVLPVQMGMVTEDFNAWWFERQTGRKVERRGDHVVCARHPFMRANLDGVTVSDKGRPAYIDFKHVGRSDEAMVLRYTPQMVHCCAILGFDHWVLSVLIGNSKHEVIEQEVDPFYREELIEKEREFWGYVERGEEPRDRVEPVLAPKPEKRLRNIDLGTAPLDTPEFREIAAKHNWATEAVERIGVFFNTEGAAKAHAICRNELKDIIPADVGELRRGRFLATRNKAGALTMTVSKGEGNG